MRRSFYSDVHDSYRDTVRSFVARHVTPSLAKWDQARLIDREVWTSAAAAGLIGLAAPEEFGGAGETDFRFRSVVMEELAGVGAHSLQNTFSLQDDVVLPYFLDLADEDQRRRWLPGLAGGTLIGAIAMTEPDTGSDVLGIKTTAKRTSNGWVINGQKTFISSGISADIVIVVARTDLQGGARGLSLFVVERDMPGFQRGRKLDKVGLHAQDTAELFFDSVEVPGANLLGEEGRGFFHLLERLPRERLSIAASAVASSVAILKVTADYCFQRKAFGSRIGDFQHSRFKLAEIETEVDVTQAYVDKAVLALNDGTLLAVDAAKAKWWATEVHKTVVDRCVQLHGGYGFMLEYAVARAFIDSRIETIYGGTTEIMKEVIGRDIAKRYGSG